MILTTQLSSDTVVYQAYDAETPADVKNAKVSQYQFHPVD